MWLFYFNILWIIISWVISIQFGNIRKKKALIILVLGYLGILTMFRSYIVGTDTRTYFAVYRDIAKTDWNGFLTYVRRSGTEPGYLFFCKLLSYISSDPQFLLIISGALAYISLGVFYYNHCELTFMSLYLFFTVGGFDFYASGIRQTIAISILLFAFEFWISNRRIPSIALIIIATSIHYSSIVIIPLLLLSNIKNSGKYDLYMIILTFTLLFGFNALLSIALRFFPKYRYYYEGVLFTREPNLAVLLKLLTFFLVFLVAKYVGRKPGNLVEDDYTDKQDKLFERLTGFIPIVYAASFNARAVARIAVLLWPFAFVYYGNRLSGMNKRNKIVVLLLSMILFFLYAFIITNFKTPEWQSTYPYSFFWQQN